MAFDFDILQTYVQDKKVTDIDSNSNTVYINHLDKGRRLVETLEEDYLKNLLNRLCNTLEINCEFNYENPVMDGEIDGLRIHATHPSYSTSGYTLNIRKNPVDLVITEKMAKKTGYCKPIVFDFMKACVKSKLSVLFGGEVGTGKTQAMKTMLSYCDPHASIVLISDIDEMRMLELYPNRNIRQYIVNDIMDYTKTTGCILRDNADYVCFQEVRDHAVDDLFKVLSSSARVSASVHLKNALLLPQRLIQLSNNKNDAHLLSTIHDYIQVCIVPCKSIVNGITKRYIGEIALFWNDAHQMPQKKLIYEQHKQHVHMYDLPAYFVQHFAKDGIKLEWSENSEKI